MTGFFTDFNRMITPTIIKWIFWIALVANAIVSIGIILHGGPLGVVYLIVGTVAIRMWVELMLVIFQIHSTLVDIRDALRRNQMVR